MAITLSSHDAFLSALASAGHIAVSSYSITSDLAGRLIGCEERGADVRVRLSAHLIGDVTGRRTAAAARTVALLRQHGIDAALVGRNGEAPHLKAAILDGAAWLDDRNFPRSGPDLMVRDDDPPDVAAVGACVDGAAVEPTARMTFTKADALVQEAAAIAAAPRGEIDVSTEDVGNGLVEAALVNRLRNGDHVRLLVDRKECTSPSARGAIDKLRSAGADIRSRSTLDKLAVTGDSAWLGSANATWLTSRTATQSDWGLVTKNPDGVNALQARFDAAWNGVHAT